MTSLSSFQKTKCLEIIDKLINWPICSPFIHDVDPNNDGAPDYLNVVKEPMSLTKVKEKLQHGEYKDLDQWKNDVNLIWTNAEEYNGPDGLFTHMAKEAELKFKKKCDRFPKDPEHEWYDRLKRTINKLREIVESPPPEVLQG